ncbi:MAG: hypothetical protein P8X74_22395, partial [Reinekea sp.]
MVFANAALFFKQIRLFLYLRQLLIILRRPNRHEPFRPVMVACQFIERGFFASVLRFVLTEREVIKVGIRHGVDLDVVVLVGVTAFQADHFCVHARFDAEAGVADLAGVGQFVGTADVGEAAGIAVLAECF